MGDEHRTKIANSQILKRLIDHAEGRVEMTQTQVTAALALMRKVLPDLTAVEHSGDVAQTYIVRMPSQINSLTDWDKHAQATLEQDSQALPSSDPAVTH